MSKQGLENILDQISSKIEGRRNTLNLEIHKYSVNYNSILNEVYREVNNSRVNINFPKDILSGPVMEYCKGLYKSFRSGTKVYNVNVLGNQYSFIVLIRQLPGNQGDIFRFIGDKRSKNLDNLQKALLYNLKAYVKEQTGRLGTRAEEGLHEIVQGSKNIKGNRIGGLLERGHYEGSSVIEHELFEPKIQFSDIVRKLPAQQSRVVDSILAKLDFKLVTNPRQHGILRDGKIVVSIFDQSKSSNLDQSNIEQNLRKEFNQVVTRVLREIDWAGLESSPNIYDILQGKFQKQAKQLGFSGTSQEYINYADNTFKSKASRDVKAKLLSSTINESLSGYIKLGQFEVPQRPANNWYSVIDIINLKLHDKLRQNMVSPRLVYRTGRFASSVKVVGVTLTNQGYPSFIYDYLRDPYDVFDRTLGAAPWNTPERDPQTLINLSIREIVQELAIGRFYLRRA